MFSTLEVLVCPPQLSYEKILKTKKTNKAMKAMATVGAFN